MTEKASTAEKDSAGTALPLRAIVPNAITVLALCFGLTGARFAIIGNWEKAVAAIIIAGVLDGIDGRIARLLKGASRFGAELDSLSDVIAFGVAPAIIIYQWALHDLGGVGWVIALAHAVCCALRLARFNANLDVDNQPHKQAGFLTGVPSPVAAGMSLSPIFLDLWLETDFFRTPPVAAIIVAVTAFLMVSNLPTFSWKSVKLQRSMRIPVLLMVGLFAGSLYSAPWGTLSLLAIGYAATIPFSVRSYYRLPRSEPAATTALPAAQSANSTASNPGAAESAAPASAEPLAAAEPEPSQRQEPSDTLPEPAERSDKNGGEPTEKRQ